MITRTTHRFVLTVFACIGMFSTESAWSAEKTIADELAAIVQVADTQMKEGTAGLADLLKVQIAVNFAKYKIEEISKDELRKKNASLEKRLISLTRAAYQQKEISTDDMLAMIDFITGHR
ncbi:MAG: hypothetical protein ABGZ31_09710 [Roseibacillus sp.]